MALSTVALKGALDRLENPGPDLTASADFKQVTAGFPATYCSLHYTDLRAGMVQTTGMLAGMLLPALSRARGEARKAVCKSNLKQVGLAVAMFRNDHDDLMPERLDDLYDEYLTARKILKCPNAPKAAGVEGDLLSSYRYVGSLPATTDPAAVVAYDKAGNHGTEWRNALFYDGHVEWIPEAQFKQRLQQSLSALRRNTAFTESPEIAAFYTNPGLAAKGRAAAGGEMPVNAGQIMMAAQAAAQPLFGYALCLTSDEDGFALRSHSPVGGVVTLGTPAILAGMLLPALARAREEARKAVCKSNLKQIGLGITIYSNDFDERYPKRLGDLYERYISRAKVFKCPSDSKPETIGKDLACSYRYVGELPITTDPQAIIAHCRHGIHAGGTNALFYDGHVEWLPNAQFSRRLKQSLKLALEAGQRPEDPDFKRRVEAFYRD